jgi:NitT/TauT family transport system permease protein
MNGEPPFKRRRKSIFRSGNCRNTLSTRWRVAGWPWDSHLSSGFIYASWAYYDRRARIVLLPALDILQSIPVLGFMPGLVLALVTLFPKSNFGLELACVLMIFTAQVWNMVFSYYDALKGVPAELRQIGELCHFGPLHRFLKIELPFAAQGLIYNCMVSMAGGWFFLTIIEAFTLGDKNFQLPGLGSYMSLAISRGTFPLKSPL